MDFTISLCLVMGSPSSYLYKQSFHPVAPYPTEWGSEGVPPGGFSPPCGQQPDPARVFRSFAASLRCCFNRPLPDSSGIAPLPFRLTGNVFLSESLPLCFLPRGPCRPLIRAGSECLIQSSGHIPRLRMYQSLHLSGRTFTTLDQKIGPIRPFNPLGPCNPCPDQFGCVCGLLAAWVDASLDLCAVVVIGADHNAACRADLVNRMNQRFAIVNVDALGRMPRSLLAR